eukprot:CAMPEP_0172189936 /NCGR_PEP_ID=MMETSP1050-20130122/22820_1 /TAXON_ID=233186 /ORGANISM="Cryptomonas curvata, Strain CCAP979/52" /LENGTH=171 /DNA_ID=CAMNT_0012864725 /DNA_START=335 /DNA_END=846 /DNA_ORIENTATION=+
MSMVDLSPLPESSSEDDRVEQCAADTTNGPQMVQPTETRTEVSHEEIDGVVVWTDKESTELTKAQKAETLALDGSTPQTCGQSFTAQHGPCSWGSETHRQHLSGSKEGSAEATGEQLPDLGFLPKGAAAHRDMSRMRKWSRSGPPSLRRAGITSAGMTRNGGAAAALWSAA